MERKISYRYRKEGANAGDVNDVDTAYLLMNARLIKHYHTYGNHPMIHIDAIRNLT